MFFTPVSKPLPIPEKLKLDGQEIKLGNYVNTVGVIYSSHLAGDAHVNCILTNVNRINGVFMSDKDMCYQQL